MKSEINFWQMWNEYDKIYVNKLLLKSIKKQRLRDQYVQL